MGRKRLLERERVPSPAGRGRQLCQSGPPTLSVGVLRRPPSKSCVVEWLSCLVPARRTLSVGGRVSDPGT
jgi:hypothetical protein